MPKISEVIPEQVIVKNPITGQDMDIMPFVKIVEQSKFRGSSFVDSIQKVHDHLSTMFLDRESEITAEGLAELCAICIEIRETFREAKL